MWNLTRSSVTMLRSNLWLKEGLSIVEKRTMSRFDNPRQESMILYLVLKKVLEKIPAGDSVSN